MNKTKIITLRLTPEQERILLSRSRSAGFLQKSDYIRYFLFMNLTTDEKINKLFERICKNGSKF